MTTDMHYMVFLGTILLTNTFSRSAESHKNGEDGANNMWLEAGGMTGVLLRNCIDVAKNKTHEGFVYAFKKCLQRRSLMILDKIINSGVIELPNGIELIRDRNNESRSLANGISEFSDAKSNWQVEVLRRIYRVLNTHTFRIHMDGVTPRSGDFEARRRHRNMMLSLMMFGIVAVGMIMIPMGFQFLAVLGGKALLLAKMALLLTSIQGLKKIATSNVNYGLYSTAAGGTAGQWHYDRQWPYEPGYGAGADPYYTNLPDQYTDLLHPSRPRIDHNYLKRKDVYAT